MDEDKAWQEYVRKGSTPVPPSWTEFADAVKEGDVVLRMLAGVVPMKLRVTKIEDGIIWCGGDTGWTFDLKTGVEEDADLGFGVASGITGSFLTQIVPEGDPDVEELP